MIKFFTSIFIDNASNMPEKPLTIQRYNGNNFCMWLQNAKSYVTVVKFGC